MNSRTASARVASTTVSSMTSITVPMRCSTSGGSGSDSKHEKFWHEKLAQDCSKVAVQCQRMGIVMDEGEEQRCIRRHGGMKNDTDTVCAAYPPNDNTLGKPDFGQGELKKTGDRCRWWKKRHVSTRAEMLYCNPDYERRTSGKGEKMFLQTAPTGWEANGARSFKKYIVLQGTGGTGESSPAMTNVTEKPRAVELDAVIDGYLKDIEQDIECQRI
ncbi:hypothetical protein IW262DRAFT_1301490 [Armillaria fumosa]|nr:hypothetical protein IW262DRAFT_1301490 [Armillaria fumosa]